MKPQKIKIFVLIAAIISFLICFNQDPYFILLPLIPLVFGMLYYILIPRNVFFGAGLLTVTVVLFVRYIIYPIELKISDFNILGSPDHASSAILLMLYEMLAILMTIRFFASRDNTSLHIEKVEVSHILPFISVVIMLYIIILHPEAFANRRWVWQSNLINEDTVAINGILLQVASWCEFLASMYLFSLLWRKYLSTHIHLYYLLSIVILFIPCLTYTGHSRLSLLIPLISYVFFVYKIYGYKVKRVVGVVSVYMIIAITILSIYKLLGSSRTSDLDYISDYSLLNSYFGGLDNVIMGLEAYERFGSSPYYFIVDSFRNMMGVSKYFEYIPSTLQYFNTAVYSHLQGFSMDQIPPTIYQGLMYFGPVFSIVPSVLMTWCVCKADKVFAKTTNVMVAYLSLGFVVAVAWAIPGSYMHLTTRVFNYLLPLSLLVLACKYIKVRI